jgi:hypothetical protein
MQWESDELDLTISCIYMMPGQAWHYFCGFQGAPEACPFACESACWTKPNAP